MNHLCFTAPVSIDREPATPVVGKSPASSVSYGSEPSLSAQVSSVGSESDKASATAATVNNEFEDAVAEPRDSKVFGGGGGGVVGILYKWVNYCKGWRSRWFVLEDGVLSYYKVHGPDKILMSPAREKSLRVIGEDSLLYMKKANWSGNRVVGDSARPCKPFGEVHLKDSLIRASKADDKRLSIFTWTKILHLRCMSREDRAVWIEAFVAAKDVFPRVLTSSGFRPSEDIAVSTKKLGFQQEGIGEAIKDCEPIMLSETSELQNQMKAMKALQHKHALLLDTLRQLETQKIELETNVVDETKEQESYCGQDKSLFAVAGGATDSILKLSEPDKADNKNNSNAADFIKTPETVLPSAASTSSTHSFGKTPGGVSLKNGSFASASSNPVVFSNLTSQNSSTSSLFRNDGSDTASIMTATTPTPSSSNSCLSTSTPAPSGPAASVSKFGSSKPSTAAASVSETSSSSAASLRKLSTDSTAVALISETSSAPAEPVKFVSSMTLTTAAPVSETSSAPGAPVFKFGCSMASTAFAPLSQSSDVVSEATKMKQDNSFGNSSSAEAATTSTASTFFGLTASAAVSTSANQSQGSISFATVSESASGIQTLPAATGVASFSQSILLQFGSSASSPTFALAGSTTFASGSSPFGSTLPAKPFSSGTTPGLGSSSSLAEANSVSSSSSSTPSVFGSSWNQIPKSPVFSFNSSPSTGFSFGASSASTATGSSPSTGFSFNASSATNAASSNSPSPGFSFGASLASSAANSSPSTGFSFGLSTSSAATNSSPSIEALVAAKDVFPRVLTSSDFRPSEDIAVSTEKLRLRLQQEGIGEAVIKDCESIMLSETSELQNQMEAMKALQHKHALLLDTLRQLEIEKIELETNVVDETKEQESYCGQDKSLFAVAGGATDSILKFSEPDKADNKNNSNAGDFIKTPETVLPSAASTSSTHSFGKTPGGVSLKNGSSASASSNPVVFSNLTSQNSSTSSLFTNDGSDTASIMTATTPTPASSNSCLSASTPAPSGPDASVSKFGSSTPSTAAAPVSETSSSSVASLLKLSTDSTAVAPISETSSTPAEPVEFESSTTLTAAAPVSETSTAPVAPEFEFGSTVASSSFAPVPHSSDVVSEAIKMKQDTSFGMPHTADDNKFTAKVSCIDSRNQKVNHEDSTPPKKDVVSGPETFVPAAQNSIAFHPQKKWAFQMSVPEEFLDSDDDSYPNGDASDALAEGSEK